MCGRFAMDKETNDLIEEFVLDGNDYRDWAISYSIAPTDPVPIIRERRSSETGEVRRTVDAAVWDFHPAFLREQKRPQFNARLETIASSGMWKRAFAQTRCLVPMRGYYEWSGDAKSKIPHFLHGETDLLTAAGLYTLRKVDDEWVVSTAIVTREARDASGDVHDRMPAFLTPDVYDEWLSPAALDAGAQEQVLGMLDAVSTGVAATVTEFEVDRRVNNSRAVDPADATLIAPLER